MKYALTDSVVKNLKLKADKKPYRITDGGGLYIQVSATGARLWRYKYRLEGKENIYSLGSYPEIGLAKARQLHTEARDLVRQGIAPKTFRETARQQKIAENADTFKVVAEEWREKKKPDWSETYHAQVSKTLVADVYPALGAMPLKLITPQSIYGVLKKTESRGASTVATLIRQLCSQVFDYAIANLKATSNPAAPLRNAIIRPPVKHNKSLKPDELKSLLLKMSSSGGYQSTRIAVKLLMLTFVRTIELRQARWKEFDFENLCWRIPAERMKMGKEHLVPLSKQAVALLIELKGITGSSPWLFPNHKRPDDCMTATTINRALERMGMSGQGTIGFSAHGFRGTASTILHEKGFRSELIERQLAHSERNQVKASYNHAEYLKERTEMMQHWSDYIKSLEESSD